MKRVLSYKSNPIIEKIEKNQLGKIAFFKVDADKFGEKIREFSYGLSDWWKQISHNFKENIFVLSKPFSEAYHLGKDKILQSEEIILSTESTSGVFIIDDLTLCFKVVNNEDFIQVIYIAFNKEVLFSFCNYVAFTDAEKNEEQIKKNNSSSWISECESIEQGMTRELAIMSWMGHVMGLINFMKYAEIQTKNLLPNDKVKDQFCKYRNDTKSKIKIINCTWFTTLVKSDEFKVRGHFRLQPFKENGVWSKKLIWITEFKKTGYTAPARKLTNHC